MDGYQNDNVSPIKVSTTTGESIRALVSRLLAKRGLRLTSFDVFSSKVIMVIIIIMLMLMLMLLVVVTMVMVMDGFQNNVQDEGKPLDLSEDCALLHCTEVSWGKMDYHV